MAENSTEGQLNKNGKAQGMHPNSRKNLDRRWVGNNHAKKDYSITRIIKEMIDEPADERWLDAQDKGKGLTWRQAIARRQLIECVRGNATLIKELNERLDGKVTQPISGEGGEPIIIKVIYDNSN